MTHLPAPAARGVVELPGQALAVQWRRYYDTQGASVLLLDGDALAVGIGLAACLAWEAAGRPLPVRWLVWVPDLEQLLQVWFADGPIEGGDGRGFAWERSREVTPAELRAMLGPEGA